MPYGRRGRTPRVAAVLVVTVLLALVMVDLMRQDSLVRSALRSLFSSTASVERLQDDSRFTRPSRPTPPRR